MRYLKTLHGMFGGDWRLATMAYNAGEYRVLQSLRKAGMNAQNAKPSALPGLSRSPMPTSRSCTPWPACWKTWKTSRA